MFKKEKPDARDRLTLTRCITILVFLFIAAPVIVAIASSFSPTALLQFPPKGFSLRWYKNVFDMGNFVNSFWKSVALAALATALDVAIGVLAGISVTKYKFPGRSALTTFFTSSMYLPGVTLGFVLLQVFGIITGIPVFIKLLIAHLVIILPYIIRNVVSVLITFNWTLEEAASSLGATPLQVFFKVTLPLIKPGLVAGALLAFLFSMDDATLSMFLCGPKFVTLPVRIMTYMEFDFDPTLAAISTLLIAFSMVAILLLNKLVGMNIFIENSSKEQ